MALQVARRLFTVDEYYRMVEAGLLARDERVELIDGQIFQMSPIGPRHAGTVDRAARLFGRLVGDAAIVRVQNPVRLSERAEPQPDLMLLRPRADFYTSSHPAAEDVLLLIEVADSSVEYDRQMKIPLYDRHGVVEVWLVNLEQDHVAVYREPTRAGYRTVHLAQRDETIHPTAFPDLAIAVADILV